LSYYHNYNSIF